MVVHIASVAFTAGILYLAVPGSDLFSWHPTCMAVGFVLLVCQVTFALHFMKIQSLVQSLNFVSNWVET